MFCTGLGNVGIRAGANPPVAGGIGVNNNPQIPHHALHPLGGGVHDVDGLHIANNNDNNRNDGIRDSDSGRGSYFLIDLII